MNGDQRADVALPHAHALVAAVARHDRVGVADALRGADLTALCVVLADLVARPSESAWLRGLLADLHDPELTDRQLAARYGIAGRQIEELVEANRIVRNPEAVIELSGGRWVNVRGVQRWVPAEGVVA